MKKLSIVLVVALMVLAVVGLVACNNKGPYDDITKTCKFPGNYEGKSFFTDGIALVTVASYTDGDTTLFHSATDNQTINIRYYSINTPESTAKVEKWGKAASNFTHDALENATIVIESTTGGAPSKDSTNSRWIGYVWYKAAGSSTFKLLNLELVENGYAECTAKSDDKYYTYFTSALNFAKKNKLHMWGNDEDPLYNNDALPITLKDFYANPDMYYDAESQTGAKVIFYAYLIDYTPSGTWRSFTAAQYDEATGNVYKIDLFIGTSTAAGSAMKIGDYYKIVGRVALRNGSYQIADVDYDSRYDNEDRCFLSQANYYLTFNSTTTYMTQFSKNLYTNVTVTGTPVLENGVLTFTGTATKRTESGTDGDAVTFTFTVAVPDGYNATTLQNKTISLTGLQLVKGSGKITVLNYSDIVIK